MLESIRLRHSVCCPFNELLNDHLRHHYSTNYSPLPETSEILIVMNLLWHGLRIYHIQVCLCAKGCPAWWLVHHMQSLFWLVSLAHLISQILDMWDTWPPPRILIRPSPIRIRFVCLLFFNKQPTESRFCWGGWGCRGWGGSHLSLRAG